MRSIATKKYKNYAGRNFKKERTPDKQTSKSRSSQMSRIRSKNTKFEEDFISLLSNKLPNAFTTHERTLKGTPDIVFKYEKVCVFLDSDFWHGWQFPRWKHLMKNDFWVNKIQNNRKRDIKNTKTLRKSGWKVIRIWEHEINKDVNVSLNRVISAI